jgi:hypothetical protein
MILLDLVFVIQKGFAMSGIVLTFPILTDKMEAWRRFCQELSGAQLQMYLSSRRRIGITHERMVLVETAFGATSMTTLEAYDVGQALGQIITSTLPFDRWYRDKILELHGINLTGYEQFVHHEPLLHNQELLFEWTLETAKLRRGKPSREHDHSDEIALLNDADGSYQ